LKVVKNSALNDPSRTEAEKSRGADYATRLGMAHLTRAWQMLLKGITEVSFAGQPLLAAEMVLIRLAHAADMPSGEDLLKLVKQSTNSVPEKSSPIVMAQSLKREQPIAETVGTPHCSRGLLVEAMKRCLLADFMDGVPVQTAGSEKGFVEIDRKWKAARVPASFPRRVAGSRWKQQRPGMAAETATGYTAAARPEADLDRAHAAFAEMWQREIDKLLKRP